MKPIELYNQNLQSAGFLQDPSQQRAIESLNLLSEKISASNDSKSGFIQRFIRKPEPIPGIYLVGTVGRGKTYLMDLFYECISESRKKRVHYHRFMMDIHERLKKLPKSPDPLVIIGKQIASNVRVLCLDEFHVTDVADAMLLSGLLATLFSHGVILVATSNTCINNLYMNGLQRERFMQAINLLDDHTVEINLHSGIDYRLEHLEKGKTFLVDTDHTKKEWMTEKLLELAPGKIEYQQAIIIYNRHIQTIALSDDVVWFDFSELCDTPRAAKDYLEIAKLYHTVLLSNIPTLVAAKDSAAKRFMHLIDALYDHRVKLIATSEQNPEQLYHGLLLTGMFERTVSRLIEMASHDYMAMAHRP